VTLLAARAAEAQGTPAPSPRFRLARLARDTALRVPGVMRADAGPAGLFVTTGEGERLEGVTCVAASGGGYEVSLRLVCGMVPLLRLADQVRATVSSSAARAGIAVTSVTVHITDLAVPEVA
jgi:hypothetical protein